MFWNSKKEQKPGINPVSKIGVYVINGKKLSPMQEYPPHAKPGSILSVVEGLGYEDNQTYTVLTSESNKTGAIIFRRHSKHPIFAVTKNASVRLSYDDIANEINMIDWGFEFRQQQFEDENH